MAFLAAEAPPLLARFSAQNLSNTAWGFAQLGGGHAPLFAAVAAEVKARGLGGFNTQNVSDLAWAMSAAGREARARRRRRRAGGAWAAAGAAPLCAPPRCARARAFCPRETPCETRAPCVRPQDPELWDALAAAAAETAGAASPHSLSDLAWAFANAGRPHPGLFAAVCAAAAGKMGPRFSLGMVADLLWCARGGGGGVRTAGVAGAWSLVARAAMARAARRAARALPAEAPRLAHRRPPHPTPPHPSRRRPGRAPRWATATSACSRPPRSCCRSSCPSSRRTPTRRPRRARAAARAARAAGGGGRARSACQPHRRAHIRAPRPRALRAQVLWALKTLRYRDAQLEAALASVVPDVGALLGGEGGG